LFADVEIIYTIYKSLKELNFWNFIININNKKLITWYLESIWVKKIQEVISIIDKKDKIKSMNPFFEKLWINKKTIDNILSFVNTSEIRNSKEIIDYFSKIDNKMIQEWIKELNYVFKNLVNLWIEEKFIFINPSISRWLNYYTWIVFETFLFWYEKLWSIASGWRYDNLASNFSKNNFPWVWWSIWLSRLICMLKEIWKIEYNNKSLTKILVLNMWEKCLINNISLVKKLRDLWINTEFYLDSNVKMQKQLKYANNKDIQYTIIQWEDEINKWLFQLKNLKTWKQQEYNLELINNKDEFIRILNIK
jgi:histidyl-tRNA synthetase